MALTEGQVQVGSLVMGSGTPYRVLSDFDPFSMQVRADASGDRAWGHGGWSGAEWAATRVVPLTVVPDGGAAAGVSGWLPLHQQLAGAMAPVGDSGREVELRFHRGGREFLMVGRPRMVEPDGTLVGTGKSYTRLAFVALDPLIYDGTDLDPVEVGLPQFVGGLSAPLSAPLSVPSIVVDGQADLVNEGTAEVGLSMTIVGPVEEPRVSLLRPDGTVQTLRFGFDLGPGQWVEVDTGARSVLLNGLPEASRRGLVAGEFPTLPGHPAGESGPTVSQLRFRAAEPSEDARVSVFPPFSAWW